LNCKKEHNTKVEKEMKKVPGATAMAIASKRQTSTWCVGSSRNPASVLESSTGRSKSELLVDQKVGFHFFSIESPTSCGIASAATATAKELGRKVKEVKKKKEKGKGRGRKERGRRRRF
jgi:hypothetical protein